MLCLRQMFSLSLAAIIFCSHNPVNTFTLGSEFASICFCFTLSLPSDSIVSTFSLYSSMLCSCVIHGDEASCQLEATRRKSLQTTSRHMSLTPFAIFSLHYSLISLACPFYDALCSLCIIFKNQFNPFFWILRFMRHACIYLPKLPEQFLEL